MITKVMSYLGGFTKCGTIIHKMRKKMQEMPFGTQDVSNMITASL